MNLLSDLLLVLGSLLLAMYCVTLSRRLKKFTALEAGMGSAIAVLSVQVDEMTRALVNAQAASVRSASELDDRLAKAEATRAKLELLVASLHDFPDDKTEKAIHSDVAVTQHKPRFVRRRVVGASSAKVAA